MNHITPSLIPSWDDFFVLDVRQLWEFEKSHIINSFHIPLDQLSYRFHEIPYEEKPVIVTCQHGIRSLRAALFLEQNGITPVYNLEGGISKWREILPLSPSLV